MNFTAFRRPVALIAAASAALSLSACSLVDAFGPQPDAALLELAHKATADSTEADGEDGTVAEIRAGHAEALYAEISRLCGIDETGTVPQSCEVNPADSEEAPSPARLGAYLTAVDEVPEESRDLVVSQAIDLASFDTTELEPAEITEPADLALLEELLIQEHAAVYALEAARAFASAPGDVDSLVDDHQLRVNLLTDMLDDAPVAAPGYTFGDAELGDEFIAEVEDTLTQAWSAAAADAVSLEGRSFLVYGAGRSAA